MLTAPFAYPPSIALLIALYTPVGQPRRHGPAWLAPNVWSPSTTEKRSVSTLTGADVPGRTALVPMSAPSAAAEVHTQLHSAHFIVPPQGKDDKLPKRQRCAHTTTHITTADNIHASQPGICAPPHTCIASHLTAHIHHAPPPLPSVVTPVNVQALSALLTHHPDKEFVQYLTYGFHFGFSIGYTGKHTTRHAPNLQSAMSRPHVINEYITNECTAGRTAGPFPSPPFSTFTVSPLGAVLKKRSKKWRLIMHLSYPSGNSVNDGIDIADFPLRYSTVYDAMDSVMQLGRHSLMAKLDIKSAFRLCPVCPSEHHLLGMYWQGQYYYDKVLPFGLRSAPFIFNCLAEALEWLARQQGITHIHHYLDDFFIAGTPNTNQCSQHLSTLTALCEQLGIPLAQDKQEGPTTLLEYLGILLDSSALEARLPLDKLNDIKSSLAKWSLRTHCTKQELLALIGTQFRSQGSTCWSYLSS